MWRNTPRLIWRQISNVHKFYVVMVDSVCELQFVHGKDMKQVLSSIISQGQKVGRVLNPFESSASRSLADLYVFCSYTYALFHHIHSLIPNVVIQRGTGECHQPLFDVNKQRSSHVHGLFGRISNVMADIKLPTYCPCVSLLNQYLPWFSSFILESKFSWVRAPARNYKPVSMY